MALSDDLLHLLPRLRRFARASLGDKALADDCVANALEAVIRDVKCGTPPISADLESTLFRYVETSLVAATDDAERQVAWRALILVQLEEMSSAEAAKVLNVHPAVVVRALNSFAARCENEKSL